MSWYFIEPRTRKYVKKYGTLSFARGFFNKYRKELLDTGLDTLKTASKKVIYKAAEATGEFIGNKIADKIAKTNTCNRWKLKKRWRNNYSARKRTRNIIIKYY